MEDKLRAYSFGKGIPVASGFDLSAKSPLDHRTVVETLSQRDAMPDIQKYNGLIVFVEANGMTYQYVDNAWKEFGFNLGDFKLQLVDNLTTADSTKALTANQGKILKESLDSHSSNSTVHITTNERTAWNNKLDLAGGKLSGSIVINATGVSYNEGIRINQAANKWSTITMGGAQDSMTGTAVNIWGIHRNPDGNFVISHNGSPETNGLALYKDGNIKWKGNKIYHAGDKPTKADIGLSNVDNTADLAKPISTATQTALNLKFDKTGGAISGDTTVAGKLTVTGMKLNIGEGLEFLSDANYFGTNLDARVIRAIDNNDTKVDGGIVFEGYATLNGTATRTEWLVLRDNVFTWKGNKIYHAGDKPTKSDVGLGNVDNTTDLAKPISTATQTALNLKADKANPAMTGTLTLDNELSLFKEASVSVSGGVTDAVLRQKQGSVWSEIRVTDGQNPDNPMDAGILARYSINAGTAWVNIFKATAGELSYKGHNVYHAGNKPSLSDLGAAASEHTHNYLPLSGGTLTGKTIVTGPTATTFATGQLQVRAAENAGVPMITLHSNGRSYASLSITETDTINFDTERNGVLKHKNANGYLHMGAMNATHCHLYTDRPDFYFNKEIFVLGAKVYHTNNKPTLAELGAAASGHNHHTDYYTKTEINDRNRVKIKDTRTANTMPNALPSYYMEVDFKDRATMNEAPGTTSYATLLSLKGWANNSGSNAYQLSFAASDTSMPRLAIRSNLVEATSWGQWYEIYHTGKKPTKADVGLSNVDDTSDANKPISTATQTALNGKANSSHDHIVVGNDTMKIYPELNNEVNFGGNNSGDTIFIGYRAKDSRPIPATFVFGGGSPGTATIKAGNVQIGGNNVYHTGRKPTLTELGAASTAVATSSANGLMSKEDKTKLDRIGDIVTLTKTLTLTTEWQDVGIEGTALETGSYLVQISGMNTGTGMWYETFTGFMSWYKDTTNNGSADEVLLHKAGHSSDKHIYIRTIRQNSPGKLKLQICCSSAVVASPFTFKFRKLI